MKTLIALAASLLAIGARAGGAAQAPHSLGHAFRATGPR